MREEESMEILLKKMQEYVKRVEQRESISINKWLEENFVACQDSESDSDEDEKTEVDKYVKTHIRRGRIF